MRTLPTSLLILASVVPCVFAACGGGQSTATQPTASANPTATSTPTPTATTDPLDAALYHEGQRVAPDMQPDGLAMKLSVAAGGHQAQNVQLASGKCYAIVAVPPQGGELALTLRIQGQPVAGPAPALGSPVPLCPPQALTLELDVMLKTGTGMVGVQLLSKFAPVSFAPPTAPSASASAGGGVDPATALLKNYSVKLAKGLDAEGAPSKQTLKEGEKMSVNMTLAAGKCYTIIAVAPTGVTDIDMVLLPPPFYTLEAGKDVRTDNIAAIGGENPLCPLVSLPMPYHLDVTAKKGTGAVTVQTYSKNK